MFLFCTSSLRQERMELGRLCPGCTAMTDTDTPQHIRSSLSHTFWFPCSHYQLFRCKNANESKTTAIFYIWIISSGCVDEDKQNIFQRIFVALACRHTHTHTYIHRHWSKTNTHTGQCNVSPTEVWRGRVSLHDHLFSIQVCRLWQSRKDCKI